MHLSVLTIGEIRNGINVLRGRGDHAQINGLLAATATAHGWTLVTRNSKDFEHTGVRVLNPFTE